MKGKQVKRIHTALLDAFPTEDSLRLMVWVALDERLANITNGDNLSAMVLNLIEWAEAKGLLNNLVRGAFKENPNNRHLRKLVDEMSNKENKGLQKSAEIQKVKWFRIPVARTPIAAGGPVLVPDQLTIGSCSEYVLISKEQLGSHASHPEDLYILDISGSSMKDRLINDKSKVLICHRETATKGQIIVAYLCDENEATLKMYFPEQEGRIRLQPANDQHAPIYTTADNLVIQGVLVCVL